MIEPIKGKRGVPRAKAVCDICFHSSDPYGCDYDRFGNPVEKQVVTKVCNVGWSHISGKLRCPKCETERKVRSVTKIKPKKDAPSGPTVDQNFEIFEMLKACYDRDVKRYKAGDTDDTIAEVLGVMPGWVASVREQHFGPDGGNESMEELAAILAQFEPLAAETIKKTEEALSTLKKRIAEADGIKSDLNRIKAAVGPRNLHKAGVR